MNSGGQHGWGDMLKLARLPVANTLQLEFMHVTGFIVKLPISCRRLNKFSDQQQVL